MNIEQFLMVRKSHVAFHVFFFYDLANLVK
mgnify:CR=1 FL=1